jgi:ketosteroid isomerase-like protein
MLGTQGVIEAIFGDAATGDLDGVLRWWAPDGILEDITIARAFRGHGEIRPYLEMYFRALPDITFEPIRLVVDGPTAVVEWAQSTVVAAPLDGTPSVGTKIFLRAVDIFHIAGGLVQHESSWYGDGWLRQRLGETGAAPPGPLPLTPPLAAKGARFQ